MEEAARAGADIICLPELYRTRYFPRHIGTDASGSAETVPGESTVSFSRIAKEHEVVIIVPLYEKAPDGKYYNSAVVINTDGTPSTPYHKVHIPQDPGFFEKGYFYPGNAYQVVSTQFGRIAVLICYDQWFPEAARCVALEGAEIIFYPTAIGHPTGDYPRRRKLAGRLGTDPAEPCHCKQCPRRRGKPGRAGRDLHILWRVLCLRCVREDPCKGQVTGRRSSLPRWTSP